MVLEQGEATSKKDKGLPEAGKLPLRLQRDPACPGGCRVLSKKPRGSSHPSVHIPGQGWPGREGMEQVLQHSQGHWSC